MRLHPSRPNPLGSSSQQIPPQATLLPHRPQPQNRPCQRSGSGIAQLQLRHCRQDVIDMRCANLNVAARQRYHLLKQTLPASPSISTCIYHHTPDWPNINFSCWNLVDELWKYHKVFILSNILRYCLSSPTAAQMRSWTASVLALQDVDKFNSDYILIVYHENLYAKKKLQRQMPPYTHTWDIQLPTHMTLAKLWH
jgi:hypothetical protein